MQITQNGLARSVIVTGKKATWLERHTAEELRDYIEKISGAALLVVAEQDIAGLPGGRILIGRPETNGLVRAFDERENNVLPAYSETENDCVAIVARGETLVLSGSNDRSVHYASCHMLQTAISALCSKVSASK